MNRPVNPIHCVAVALALASALLAVPAVATNDTSKAPIRVAVLPIMNRSPEPGAARIMEDVLRYRLAEVDTKTATFLMPDDVERLLIDRGGVDRARRVAERWGKDRSVDSTAIAGLDSVLMVDALLCVKISEWEDHRVRVVGQGASSTTVGLQLALLDIRNMDVTWSKSPRVQEFAEAPDPTMVGYDATGLIQTGASTDPPHFDDVASRLVREALKKFPVK